jgi:hypothetical protein
MPLTQEDITRWHEQLRAEFSCGGIVGDNLYAVHVAEEAYEHFVCTQFKGYRLVHQCFLSFLRETLNVGEQVAMKLPNQSQWQWYRPLLAFGANIFSRARAAEILYLHGYPLDGYALLRDLKDRAIYLAGTLQGLTTLPDILGFESLSGEIAATDYWEVGRRMATRRRKEQRSVLKQFTGRSAGLTPRLEEDLRRWEELFDEEVHLSVKTFFLEGGDWLKGRRGLPTGPQQNLFSQTMYMNRSAEVAWCLTRTLPIFQPASQAFGSEWARRWTLVQDNLHLLVSSLAEEGKDLVQSLVDWVNLKFPFDPKWSYEGRP